MISNSKISPTLPVVDLERAKKFYRDTLGLRISGEDEAGVLFEAGSGCNLYIYKRGPTKADHTVLSFDVEDVRKEVDELRRKGVRFEEYNMPEMGLKTVNGIATMRSGQYVTDSAWFKDTEGNILALVHMAPVGQPKGEREPVGATASGPGYEEYDY